MVRVRHHLGNVSWTGRVFGGCLRGAWLLALALPLAACGLATPQVVQDIETLPSADFVASPTPTSVPGVSTSPQPTGSPTVLPTTPEPPHPPQPAPTVRPSPPVDPGVGLSQVHEKGFSGRREIALTFDAGADRGNGEAILDRLAEYGVIASFGVTGQWAEANPDLIRRMVAEGHSVFNHSWSHRSWSGRSTSSDPNDASTWIPLSREERISELARTEEVIREIADYDVRPYFRPAYGDLDSAALTDLADAGYLVTVMWSCESFAWKGWTAEEIVAYCTTYMAPGDIILLHVGAQGADYDALPGLIEELGAQGFDFVTIEQILQL
jgi:peptidoglycan/xylan/chitin deacetylase (PgdA/CDA1 family)